MPITYNPATNEILILGGYASGVIESYSVDQWGQGNLVSADFSNIFRLAPNTVGKQIYMLGGVENFKSKVRSILTGNWSTVQTAVAFDIVPQAGDAYIVSYGLDDILAADIAGAWGVFTKAGDSAYYSTASIIMGDWVTATYLAGYMESIEFIDAGRSLQTRGGQAVFQLGEWFRGSSRSGCMLKYRSAGWFNCGANDGRWLFFDSKINVAGQNYYLNNSKLLAYDTNFAGYHPTVFYELQINAAGSEFVSCDFAMPAADGSRDLVFTLKKNAVFENVAFADNVRFLIYIYTGIDLYLDGISVGGGDKQFLIQSYSSALSTVHALAPSASLPISLWNMGSTITDNVLQYEFFFNCTVRNVDETPIVGALVTLTEVTGLITSIYVTDAAGAIPEQRLTTTSRNKTILFDVTTNVSPYKGRYFSYGKVPVELTKPFNDHTTDDLTLYADPNVTLTKAAALAVTGVTMVQGSYTDAGNNAYSYKVDCGGNTLLNVFHNLAARMATDNVNDPEIIKARGRMTQMMTSSNGSTFGGGVGLYFINYQGNIEYMTADDGTRFAPTTYSLYSYSGLNPDSSIHVIDNVTGAELDGIEYLLGDTFVYQYSYNGVPQSVRFEIQHVDYRPITSHVTLTGIDVSNSITQEFDRVYYNPVAPILAGNVINTGKNSPITFSDADIYAGATLDGLPFNAADWSGISISGQPANGAIVDNNNGTYTYTPTTNFLGTDSVQFMPLYNVNYSGVVLPLTLSFNTAPFFGTKFDNLIILGDSISVIWFNSGGIQEFNDKHQALYGRKLSVYNEAVNGWSTTTLLSGVDAILAKYTHLNAAKTVVWCCIGTNDIHHTGNPSRLTGDASNLAGRQWTKSQIQNTVVKVKAAGFEFVQAQIPFLQYDTGIAGEIVWNRATKIMENEAIGSIGFNVALDGIDDTAAVTSPSYVLSDGTPVDQLYRITRQIRDTGYSDIVHPNPWGARFGRQAVLDGFCLHNEYGKFPFPTANDLAHQVSINLTDAAQVAPNDLLGRVANNIDYATTGTVANAALVLNSGATSPYTISIDAGGALVASSAGVGLREGWISEGYLTNAIQVAPAGILTITIGGVTPNEIYKIQGIGSFLATNRIGIMKNAELNRQTTCDAGLFYDIDNVYTANTQNIYDMTLIPQGNTISVTLECADAQQVGAYINALVFWHHASGV